MNDWDSNHYQKSLDIDLKCYIYIAMVKLNLFLMSYSRTRDDLVTVFQFASDMASFFCIPKHKIYEDTLKSSNA